MSDKTIINVQYNVPRYILGRPGKQNHACTGEMRITPGVAEPFEFVYMNSDGVSLNLAGFRLLWVFFFPHAQYESLSSNLAGNIVLAKYLSVTDPYSGICTAVLSDEETLILAASGRSTLRWAIYMTNEEGQTFASQITSDGERFGIAHLDRAEIPSAEIIKGISISE